MSADKQLEIKAKTDNGNVHAMFMNWQRKVMEQPAVRTTREDVIAALEQDPALAGFVAKIKREVPAGSVMFITEAMSGSNVEGPLVEMTVRFG